MSDDSERAFNFMVFKFWGTDQEMAEAAPIIIVGSLIALVILLLVIYFNSTGGKSPIMQRYEHLKSDVQEEKPSKQPLERVTNI
jgi:ABC-type Fe3+ transport system permease subunit